MFLIFGCLCRGLSQSPYIRSGSIPVSPGYTEMISIETLYILHLFFLFPAFSNDHALFDGGKLRALAFEDPLDGSDRLLLLWSDLHSLRSLLKISLIKRPTRLPSLLNKCDLYPPTFLYLFSSEFTACLTRISIASISGHVGRQPLAVQEVPYNGS